jgi:murein DD-endopeptidase MepM/ murein hydrolase activator NlpD
MRAGAGSVFLSIDFNALTAVQPVHTGDEVTIASASVSSASATATPAAVAAARVQAGVTPKAELPRLVADTSTGPVRCRDGVWGLPVRANGYRLTATFGFKNANSSYSKGLIARGAVEADSTGIFHAGIDLAADTGDPLYAVTEGTVVKVGYTDQYGKHIIIEHASSGATGAVDTRQHLLFAHLSQPMVKVGDVVRCGQLIGLAGGTGKALTGPHLHLELRDARSGKPLNPSKPLKQAFDAASALVQR